MIASLDLFFLTLMIGAAQSAIIWVWLVYYNFTKK
jgi:hypothetical protein